jgi:hypothetical protein
VVTGGINKIEPPYSLVIINCGSLSDVSRAMVDRFVEFFKNDLDTPVRVLKREYVGE